MAKRSEVSIRDIARQAGVSITTVSRILNQDEALRITDSTRDRVLETAQALGYEPNFFAAALRSNRTGILGALSPNLAGTFLPLLTQELLWAARTRGVELLVGSPEVDEANITVQLKTLQNLLFDGLLLLGDMLDYQASIRKLKVMQKPYVAVCAGMNVPPPLVNVDDKQATVLAVDYLIRLGHRRIAFLGSTRWNQEHDRVVFFRQQMQQRGIAVREEYVAIMQDAPYIPFDPKFRENWTTEPLRAAQALMRLDEPPTAILCANDGFATAASKGALQLGVDVPGLLSIIGYNDELQSTLFHPELTTIRQPLDQIANLAVELLLKMIDSPDPAHADVRLLVTPQLIPRQTCAPPHDLGY